MGNRWQGPLEQIDDFKWRIPESYQKGMHVPGVIYSDKSIIQSVLGDQAPQQVANVAHLPGVLKYAMAMPDIHWGYGFPIGGVAAVDVQSGVISPGGVGYDINCGVRLIRTDLTVREIKNRIQTLIDRLFVNIPSGVGSTSKLKLSEKALKKVLNTGSQWAINQGYGWQEDIEYTEANGCLAQADANLLSQRALERGLPQLGTLGSGNHFLEIQVVDEIYDSEAAKAFGISKEQITIMIHTGSRGLGYQVCDDSLDTITKAMQKYKIQVPDKQLVCVPVNSFEAQSYLGSMAAAANYAWANRQLITHWVRETFEQTLNQSAEHLGMHLVYDIAHNIAKFEDHNIEGKLHKVLVHRKGATRAFGPNHKEIPACYRKYGQPVLIPGDMGTASYILAGTEKAMNETFGSTCHGAGRVLSRHAAIKKTKGRMLDQELAKQGIIVRSRGKRTLHEEAPEAYKNIHSVVNIVHQAGISKKVARMKPLGVIKG